jgi:hypothetical protein
MLPFQGERFYAQCAVALLVKTRRISIADLGVGIRGSVHLARETFREPLDAIENALPEHLRKLGINSWLGALQCAELRWKVISGSRDLLLPFRGRVLTRESPEGYDHCLEQRVASLSNFTPLVWTVLDMELCEMAMITQRLAAYGPRCVKQLRVDGVVCQVPRTKKAEVLAWDKERGAAGQKYKVEQLAPDSRSIITIGTFQPYCGPGTAPPGCGGWEALEVTEAEAHMRGGGSIYIQGQGGTGKSYFVNQQLPCFRRRPTWPATDSGGTGRCSPSHASTASTSNRGAWSLRRSW